jgi:DNA-binding transcriptional LysR family regulator
MHSMNWGDLRYVLAVAKEGSAAAAARVLKVNHSTVIRRVRSFEKTQNIRIFDHLASGYRLTAKGEIFLDAARSIDATLSELGRKVAGGDTALEGDVRVTTTDGLFPLLIEDFTEFRRAYPRMTLDLSITNLQLNLDELDADIAIRPTSSPPPALVGRRVCDVAFGVYGAASWARKGEFPSIEETPWLGLNAPLSESGPGRWIGESITTSQVVMRCNSFPSLVALAAQGLGYCVLPCWLGDDSPALRRVLPEPLSFRNPLWLLYHADMLRARRVRACVDFLFAALKAKQRLMEGTVPGQ